MIIANVGAKGGVGKSTLAVHMAAWFHIYDYATVLVDSDLQQLSSWWLSSSMPELPSLQLSDANRITTEVPKLLEQYDVVIVDGPGELSQVTGAILSVADAALLPTGPSNIEIQGLNWTIQTVNAVREAREDGKPAAVIVPVRATMGRKTTKHLYSLAPQLGCGITLNTLPYRATYEQASGLQDRPPRLLWQMGRSKLVRQAALEMDMLIQGIFPEACEDDVGRIARLVSKQNKSPKHNNIEKSNAKKERRIA